MALRERLARLERVAQRHSSELLIVMAFRSPPAEVDLAAVTIDGTVVRRQPGETLDELEERALRGRRGLVRIDYILGDEACWFLEVNTVPGLSAASIVPKMALADGLTLCEFYTRLVDQALLGARRPKPQTADASRR